MKKKILTFALLVILTFGATSAGALLASSPVRVTIDGAAVTFPGDDPIIVGHRVLVPIRPVFVALGFYVHWDPQAQTATITRQSDEIIITIGERIFYANGAAHHFDEPAQIIGASTMVPLRLPLESVGYTVVWDGAARTVVVTTVLPDLAFELEVLRLTNVERVNHGLAPLIWHETLAAAARAHSEDMARNNFMSHTGSDGSSMRSRIEGAGIRNWSALAENVARGHRNPEQVVTAWMNSQDHRANILDAQLVYLGVGFSENSWTQKFATIR